jgi:hypothetical protein
VNHKRETPKLARWQSKTLMWIGLLLWVTGLAWLGLHYFGRAEGEFGPEINPLEPWTLRLHGLLIIPAYVLLGSLLVAHIPLGWKVRTQRSAGLGLAVVLLLLIVSGYALYYVGSVELREYTSLFHWTLGLAVPAFFYWHYRRRFAARLERKKKNRLGLF